MASAASGADYKSFNLPCLAPLLEGVDSEAPATMEVAFLRGPLRGTELREGVGKVDFSISTESAEAQAFFNQGVALLHGLDYGEAERSFREALVRDGDHPMIFWGLAMSNEQRPQRARLFAQQAIRRLSNETTPRERQWVEALARFAQVRADGPDKLPPPPELSDEEIRELKRQRIRDLEALVLSDPDDVEARAFLLRQLTLDEHRSGIPITSHVAVDGLARELAEAAPEHPSRHYRIFLWLGENPNMAQSPAGESALLAPDLADSWRYAAEAWTASGYHHRAIPFLEAALRVDHRRMREHLLMPGEIATLTSNYTALVESLASMGRVREAVEWSRRMMTLPRDLEPNRGIGEGMNAVGKRLFVQAHLGAELFGELLEKLDSEPLLFPRKQSPFEQAQWRYWKALALASLDRDEEVEALQKEITQFSERADSKAAQEAMTRLLRGLETWKELSNKTLNEDSDVPPPPNFPAWQWARELTKAGHPELGLRVANETLDQSSGRWLAAAAVCELSFASNDAIAAMRIFDRRFRTDAARTDADLPVLKRLNPVAERMQLPKRWILRSSDPELPGLPSDPESLGPLFWKPPIAPAFSLPDHAGREISLESFRGKPVLLQFILGVGCPYCAEQLNLFRPHLPAFNHAGIETVAITRDPVEVLTNVFGEGPEKNPEAAESFPFPVIADPELQIFKNYGVFDDFESGGMHATILVGSQGRVLWRHASHGPFDQPRELLEEARRLLKIYGTEE